MSPLLRLLFAAVSVSALSSCAAVDDAADAEETESAASSDRFAGEYLVPVDASLAHAASNPVSLRFRAEGRGEVRLRYRLPTVLAGVDKGVDLVGSRNADGSWSLTGPAGTAHCTEAAGAITCNEHLPGVSVDLAQASAALDASGLSPEEKKDRFSVAEKFAFDPLGVLTFSRGYGYGRGRDR